MHRYITVPILSILAATTVGQEPLPRKVRPTVRAAAEESNDFAIRLLRSLGSGNQVVAPHCLRESFAICLAATDGASRQQIADVMNFGAKDVHDRFARLRASVTLAKARNAALRTSGRLWLSPRDDYFEAPFLYFARTRYDWALGYVDFGAPEKARLEINRWVEKETAAAVPELLARAALTKGTVMAMTNAVHFVGKWRDPFDPKRTRELPFRIAGKDPVRVPFLNRAGSYATTQRDGCKAVALPYADGHLRLVVMLPDRDLEAFTAQLSAARYAALRSAFKHQLLRFGMPRVALARDYAMHSNVLPALGMTAPFRPSKDWTPLNGDREELCITSVHQSVRLQVSEGGTEAAAGNAVVVGKSAPSRLLRIDRPFVFAIEHVDSGLILFLGQVADPSQAG